MGFQTFVMGRVFTIPSRVINKICEWIIQEPFYIIYTLSDYMGTTIQVTEDVLEMLTQMRSLSRARSYNYVLRGLLHKRNKSFGGMLGRRMSRSEILSDLRDEEE